MSDKLREMFMCGDESENAGLYTDDEKNEFIYHVMQFCVFVFVTIQSQGLQ